MTVSVGHFSFVSAKNLVYIVSSVYWTPGGHRETPNWALGNYKERKEHHSLLWRAYSLMGRLRWQIPFPGDEHHHRWHQVCLQLTFPGGRCMLLLWTGWKGSSDRWHYNCKMKIYIWGLWVLVSFPWRSNRIMFVCVCVCWLWEKRKGLNISLIRKDHAFWSSVELISQGNMH